MLNNNFISLEIPSASICQLDCSYCYVPKNKLLIKIHNKWKKVYKSGTGLEIISTAYKQNSLTAMSLWGAEPSLGFKDYVNLKEFLNYNPKLNDFSTSTNFVEIDNLLYLVNELNNFFKTRGKMARLRVQISIDGPEHITNSNRGKNVYQTIFKNLEKLKYSLEDITNVNIILLTKTTFIVKNYIDVISNPNPFKDYLLKIASVEDEMKDYFKNKEKKNITPRLVGLPTLGLPGTYTTEDGKIFSKYLQHQDKMLNELGGRFAKQLSAYDIRILNLLNDSTKLNFRDTNYTFHCSAGAAMQSIDMDGTTHGCHASFWFNYDEYETQVDKDLDWSEGSRIFELSKEKMGCNLSQSISSFRDKYNETRIKYALRGHISHLEHATNISYGTIRIMANAGQLSPIYKKEEFAKLLAAYIRMTSDCWSTNSIVTGNYSSFPLSLYRMFGNGAFEYLLKKVSNELKEII